jgi:hypothetical protein
MLKPPPSIVAKVWCLTVRGFPAVVPPPLGEPSRGFLGVQGASPA